MRASTGSAFGTSFSWIFGLAAGSAAVSVGAVACRGGAVAAFCGLVGSQEISPSRAAPAITQTEKREPILAASYPCVLTALNQTIYSGNRTIALKLGSMQQTT